MLNYAPTPPIWPFAKAFAVGFIPSFLLGFFPPLIGPSAVAITLGAYYQGSYDDTRRLGNNKILLATMAFGCMVGGAWSGAWLLNAMLPTWLIPLVDSVPGVCFVLSYKTTNWFMD